MDRAAVGLEVERAYAARFRTREARALVQSLISRYWGHRPDDTPHLQQGLPRLRLGDTEVGLPLTQGEVATLRAEVLGLMVTQQGCSLPLSQWLAPDLSDAQVDTILQVIVR